MNFRSHSEHKIHTVTVHRDRFRLPLAADSGTTIMFIHNFEAVHFEPSLMRELLDVVAMFLFENVVVSRGLSAARL